MIDAGERPLFSFAIIADTHITYEEGRRSDRQTARMGAAEYASMLQTIGAMTPGFVIHLGDLTHPGPLSDAYGDAAREFFELSAALGVPLHLVPGNHDIGEKIGPTLPEIDERISISERSISKYEQHFAPQYTTFEHGGCVFVLLNSLLINSGLDDEEAQWRWLEAALGTNGGKRTFAFAHDPMFLTAVDERDHYDNISQPGRERLMRLLQEHQVEGYFSGHVHNFFFNQVGSLRIFSLPSTSFLRHDYLEFFRCAPASRARGRYDLAKRGFLWVDVYPSGHVPHLIRLDGTQSRRTHSWRNAGAMPVIDLRQAWSEQVDTTSPWGAEIFERKPVRNDYPLSALWEMGIRQLRIPISDLLDPDAAARVAVLGEIGHRFTVVAFGIPDAERQAALARHVDVLRAVEIVAILPRSPALAGDLAELGQLLGCPILLNPVRTEVEGYTSHHGFRAGDDSDLGWLWDQSELRGAVDGVVFGVPLAAPIAEGVAAARVAADKLGLTCAIHVPCVSMHRTEAPEDESSNVHELNRVAEAAILARTHPDTPIVLDNFVALDRGYFHCFGLVDRLYNPLDGSRILTALDALLPRRPATLSVHGGATHRILMMRERERTALLLLAKTGLTDDALLPPLDTALANRQGLLVDLRGGEDVRMCIKEIEECAVIADRMRPPILLVIGGNSI